MKKLHYFPFYYLDWLSSSSVQMMTYDEKGLFIDMLCRCYNDDGLPDDNNKLKRLFKCDEDVLDVVKDMFFSVEGVLKNKKLEEVKRDQEKLSQKKSRAGKASAKARSIKKLQSSTGVEQVLNCVATEPQQNLTNKTKQNKVKIKENIEQRKQAFRNNIRDKWIELGKSEYLSEQEIFNFYEYWTEHAENDTKLRFEKEKSFGIGRRLGTWKKNNFNNSSDYSEGRGNA